jgi:peptidoglycan/LPS O-acetylase OafA/YrhL
MVGAFAKGSETTLDERRAIMSRAPRIADRAQGRDNHFDLVRLLAASGVLVSHAYPISLGPGTAEPLQAILHGRTLGGVCVMLFFAISGFFIAQSFERRTSLADFLRARALRLFPALAVVLAVTVLVAGAVLTSAPAAVFWPGAAEYYLRNITLFFLRYELPGVFEANPYGPAINGSLWTLNYEVLCYLGVVLAGLAGLLARPRAFAVAVLAFLVAYAAVMELRPHPRLVGLMSLGLPFLVGMAFHVWRRAIPLSPLLLLLLWAVAAAAWAVPPLFVPVLSVALAYSVFLFGYARSTPLARLRLPGDYSYGTYVYAFPIQQLVAASGIVDPLTGIALAFPATLGCAILSWHLVEAPALRLRHRRAGAAARIVVR